MGSSSPTSAPSRRAAPGGFTLLEVMMSTLITAIVFMGVISAYTFLGRSLIRQGNEEQLESQARVSLFWFTQDASTATSVDPTNLTTTSVSFFLPSSTSEATYTYDAGAGTLTRTTTGNAPGPSTLLLMTKLTGFTFNYYNYVAAPTATVPPVPPAAGVKAMNMAFALAAGTQMSGSLATYMVTSPRVVLKNKVYLGASPGIP